MNKWWVTEMVKDSKCWVTETYEFVKEVKLDGEALSDIEISRLVEIANDRNMSSMNIGNVVKASVDTLFKRTFAVLEPEGFSTSEIITAITEALEIDDVDGFINYIPLRYLERLQTETGLRVDPRHKKIIKRMDNASV